ncbi:hypothetical protein BpHYR1_015386 [Brachionus plicatilis]|uniref:Uncharacterized protein n=1 Tax=Brachionus plicatilis TaxID=10195 RepID=A0A3M7PEW2_BRAPC|nr:hypothetical protein BpHYR1_015386 [Brachionus plicatilis]
MLTCKEYTWVNNFGALLNVPSTKMCDFSISCKIFSFPKIKNLSLSSAPESNNKDKTFSFKVNLSSSGMSLTSTFKPLNCADENTDNDIDDEERPAKKSRKLYNS